jgi:methyl-accepting chemotaxis protein
MNRFNISTRLAIGFGVMLVFIALLALVGLWRIQGSSAMTRQLLDQQLRSERLINTWSKFIGINTARTMAAARTTDAQTQKFFEDQMADTSVEGAQVQKQLRESLADPKAIAMFEGVLKKRADYRDARAAALKARKQGDEATAKRFFETEMDGLLNDYVKSVEALLTYQQDHINQSGAALDQNNRLGFQLMLVLGALALLFGVVFAWYITRSITVPLRKAVGFAETVSNRDLTGSIEVRGNDETSQLLRALQRMNTNLLGVVRQVRQGAESIATASGQIAAGNLDLSSRTEEQASSLAETAATMEQLTHTVRQNADNARQANGLSETAAQAATRSGDAVTRVVDTMGAIDASSQQIVDIISVIDGIAFQTNILALNAAVEAARAGDQGKGFAVVASEVRTLAQRSAAAAREIKDLIDKSVNITKEGNRIVAEAGNTMHETVQGIQRVTDLMAEITAAGQEQSIGIDQVNQAVGQMDEVTQQNASLVQQASAASESLQDQAAELARLVATFRVEASHRAISHDTSVVEVNDAPKLSLT